jgi:hypothetical protein
VIEDWSDELSTIVAARAAPLEIGTRRQRGDSAGEEALVRRAAGGGDGDDFFLDGKPLWSNVFWAQRAKGAREGGRPEKPVVEKVAVMCGQREAADDEMRRVTEKWERVEGSGQSAG